MEVNSKKKVLNFKFQTPTKSSKDLFKKNQGKSYQRTARVTLQDEKKAERKQIELHFKC
jgi:hypothetical protein